ncbi:LINE-1 reverse transcriptase isogeny [Gossypium australe]|uniref:LINE-1 reverse transcriptase isogeny n=1 Tax=Gossypium australe TaxID=47621 RepID=A0A5B6W752_9ROSI|nr:LINE-1 reverse transcriptase isogeny [Gossypium australe]
MGQQGGLALKLDMSKIYDRVEWVFLEKPMLKMGFAKSVMELVLKCISLVNYSICLNGDMGEHFKLTRGLRQGDPLSPYLFLIYNEGLSSLMRSASREGTIKGARVCRRRSVITYLLFANDCIFFGDTTNKGAQNLKVFLCEYEICSGSNISERRKEQIANILEVRTSRNPQKYLGLPNMVGRDKKRTFKILKDGVLSKINGWSTRHLSHGGNEVFIKSI